MSKKLQFIKQDQPKFIQQFKKRVGLKHEPTLEDKVQSDDKEIDDLPVKDDEKPVIVVLKEGDLTAEQAAEEGVDDGQEDGKIKYRKPTVAKRNAPSVGLSASSKKKPKIDEKTKPVKASDKKKKSGVKSKSLLSFAPDEDEY